MRPTKTNKQTNKFVSTIIFCRETVKKQELRQHLPRQLPNTETNFED